MSHKSSYLTLLGGLFLFLLLDGTQGENTLYKECRPFFLPLDVIFLLDGSGSVSGNTFDMQMNMLKKVAERIDLDGGKSRLAVIQYAGYSRLEIQFEANQTRNQVSATLEKIRYMSGSTKTGKALKKAKTILEEEKKKAAGGRGRVKQVAIIVSDGHSHDDPSKPAALLRADGVSLLVLGIGHYINREELLQISGSEEHVFQDLHKEEEMDKFIADFVNTSQQIVCDYARKPRGASAICNRDGFAITASTTENFHGALYVTGHYNVSNCFSRSNKLIKDGETIHYDTTLVVNYKACGVQETFTESTRLYSVVVILQFDPLIATNKDVFYRIRCEKEEISGDIKVLDENAPLARPICRYTVRPIGNCGAIVLNDPLLHTWQCDSDRVDIDVAQCFMMDPVMHRSYPLLDEQGCSLSPYISEVNQAAPSIITAKGTAIRFPSSSLVYFRCTLRICGGGRCEKQACRKKREIGLDDYEYNEEFPSAEVRKLSTLPPIEPSTTGRAIINALAMHHDPIGVDVILRSEDLAIINGQGEESLKEVKNTRAELKALEDSKPPSLVVFGKSKRLEKIIPKTTAKIITSTIPTTGFPTLLAEATTDQTTSEIPWQIEITVESDPLLIQLPHEAFTTTCNKN